jgi:hypothetical protein
MIRSQALFTPISSEFPILLYSLHPPEPFQKIPLWLLAPLHVRQPRGVFGLVTTWKFMLSLQKPYTMWAAHDRRWVAIVGWIDVGSWAATLFIHAEEASFWWFLLQLSMESTPYFRSPAFFLFLTFSVASLAILIAVTTVWASADPMHLEAVVYLYGSSATLLINMMFFRSGPQTNVCSNYC